ncbi:MAG: exodeoxyribonuclease VII large subunit [Acidimicrobiia bacterium]|nr:exodeoxyribonuclease VII large subunit [Acidimicrobiia bacterium]
MTLSYTVAELSDQLAAVLSTTFPDDVWVAGEIRDLNRSNAGHVWFDLVESDESGSQVRLPVVCSTATVAP